MAESITRKNIDLDILDYYDGKIKVYVDDKVGTGGLTIDDTLSDTSTNPVQNKIVKQAIDNKADKTVATKDTDGLMSASDKGKLDNADNTYALKSKYGDTTIDVGRKANTNAGRYSTAEGYRTTASGNGSHAEGSGTTASGGYSHAEGINTTASGLASHAGGIGTKALHDNEVAYGKYNKSNADTVFSVGDGTADDARHNAFEITTTGGKLHDKDIATTDLIPTELPANGGNADYATNAGNAEKLGGKDASAYSTSIIKSVTFSAATTNGYIWTGIAFPKYIVGIDLEYFDVIVQFYKGNHADAARAEWAMMFFSKDDVTTPLNGSFNGTIYYID